MPKCLTVSPEDVRKSGSLKIADIPLNAYKPDFSAERKKFGDERLVRILRDMTIVREFETMLNLIKTVGEYEGVKYQHAGPAHLSIGQEASSVGQAAGLTVEDLVFGSHRSHGEILAKCLSAVYLLPDNELERIMKSWLNGDTLKAAAQGFAGGSIRDLTVRFVVYGTLSEIFARSPGFNRGLGGSMHAFFPPFGSMPNNAIVGGSGDISVGGALFKRVNRKPGIVVCNIGDASMGCGPVWEGISIASMDQYRTLWDKEIGGAPPILFNFFNNFYGMGGQTCGETMGYQILARIGAGVNPENMHAERVDGYNPLAVADAVERKKKILTEGRGPALLDTVTYRFSGHSPSDASSYRTKEELELWQKQDCVESFGAYLVKNAALTADGLAVLKDDVKKLVREVLILSTDDKVSPRVDGPFIESVMYSNAKEESRDPSRQPEIIDAGETNPRIAAIRKRERYAFDAAGKPVPKTKLYSLRDGLFEALLHRFQKDPTLIAFGEENRDWGGAFGVYRGLTEALPYHRLFNASISEGAIVGAGVGYALSGGRAVVELMYCDFLGRAGDEIFNQMSKWQAMSAGTLKMPLVLRISVGAKYGAQHSQDWTAFCAHIPGLKVMYPATPYDAKGMLNLALAGTDPVVFFESQKLYDVGELFEKGGVPEGYYEIPEGLPVVRRTGKDLTIVTLGPTLYKALEAAADLEGKYGLSTEIVDLRFVNPLDYDVVIASVRKTGRAVFVTDACERGSFMSEAAITVSQACFDDLDAPIAVVGSRNWITPAAEMESLFFPQKEDIIDTVHERLLPLPGHTPTTNRTDREMLRRHRKGV
jgi:2-oxoisovalerate dehydrogenase E1 component